MNTLKKLTVFKEFIKNLSQELPYLVDKMETMKKRQDSIIWTF